MKTTRRPRLPVPALLVGLALLPSCVAIHRWQKRQTQKHREIELQDVTKSWCQTIRASQVIPVYPLTEDLQPGDVFLVRRTIEEQAEEYKEEGFLPLDYHLLRLDPGGYAEFYSHSVLAKDPPEATAPTEGSESLPPVPGRWMRPGGVPSFPGEEGPAWDQAPAAAFPSYSFSTQSGAGFNLAVPVQGVPVGLALLGNQAAAGTITISDARTLGVDILSLWKQLRDEIGKPERAAELGRYAARPGKPAYLRAVTRIYLAGAMDVSISSSSSFGAGLDVGAPRPVQLLTQGPPEDGQARAATTEEFAANLTRVNEMLAADPSPPGGSVRVTMAGGNTVGLRDTFDPPLVVGYLGFDCEILPGGALGFPVPTQVALLDASAAKVLFQTNRVAYAHDRASMRAGLRLLRESVGSDAVARELVESGRAVADALDRLASEVDESMPTFQRDPEAPGFVLACGVFGPRPPNDAAGPYERFVAYRTSLERSVNTIEAALEAGEFRVRDGQTLSDPIDVEDTGTFAPIEAARRRIVEEGQRVATLDEVPLRDLRAWLVRFWSAETSTEQE